MTKFKLVTAAKLERIILKIGFVKVRQKGSHAFYRHSDGRTTTIPHHAGCDLPSPLLRTILREIRLGVDEFNNLVND